MNQKYRALREKLTQLSDRKPGLGARMSQAAIELKDAGVPPAELLLEQLNTYRQEFGQLRDQVKELAKSLPKPPMPPQITSLKDIDNILEQLEESEAPSGTDRETALQILDQVLAIAHSEDPQFPPLQDAKAKARELRRLIAEAPAKVLPEPVQALNSGEHPFAGLLTLINPPSDLTDDRWGILVEVVTRAFSKSLTVAAARGKLTVDMAIPSVSTVAQATPPTVAKPSQPGQPGQPPLTLPSKGRESGSQVPEVLIIGEEGTTGAPASEESVLKPPATQVNSPDVIILPSYEPPQNPPPNPPAKPAEPLVFGSVPLSSKTNPNPPSPSTTESLGLKVLVHIERLGDRLFNHDEFAGTRGKALRIEGFAIKMEPSISGLSLEYMAHIEGIGDSPWTTEGEFLGRRGEGKRIEGFAIRLTGENAKNYNVYYVAHIENLGDSTVCFNGNYCGTRGQGLRVEGIKVWLQKKR
jgi:hypothetical protein